MVVLASVLAGCTGGGSKGEAPPTSSDPGGGPSTTISVDDEKGAIRGLVQSDELLPIPLATVELVGEGTRTVTNGTGIFVFDDLDPGTYQVEVTVGDNEPVTQEAEVAAGEVNDDLVFTITLEAPVQNVPYRVTSVFTGYIECDFNAAPCPGIPEGNDKQNFNHTWEGTPVAFLYEVAWERPFPGVVPPSTLCPPLPEPPPPLFCPGFDEEDQPSWVHRLQTSASIKSLSVNRFAIGPPPYARMTFNASEAQTTFEEDKNPSELAVVSGPNGFLRPPSYAYQTRFDIYATVFYVDPEPAKSLCFAPPDKCPQGLTPA